MQFLLMFLLLFVGCEDDPVSPETDCTGVIGGSAVINQCDLCVGCAPICLITPFSVNSFG